MFTWLITMIKIGPKEEIEIGYQIRNVNGVNQKDTNLNNVLMLIPSIGPCISAIIVMDTGIMKTGVLKKKKYE